MLVVSKAIAPGDQKHIHLELQTDSIATTACYVTASGNMMRSVMRKMDNGVVGETFLYELELPYAEKIQIIHHVNRGTGWQLCWQERRISRGVCGEWTGKFESATEAAQEIQSRPAMFLQ